MRDFEWHLDKYELPSDKVYLRRLIRACKMPLKITVAREPGRAFLRDSSNYNYNGPGNGNGNGNGYILASFYFDEGDDLRPLTNVLYDAFLVKYRRYLE